MRVRQQFDDHDLDETFDAPLDAAGADDRRELHRILVVLLCLSFACLALAASNLILIAFIRAPHAAVTRPASPRVASAEEHVPAASPGENAPDASTSARGTGPIAIAPEPPEADATIAKSADAPPAAAPAAAPPRITERQSPKAPRAVELPSRPVLAAGVTTDTVEGPKAADPSERTAQWMIDTHGRSYAAERAQAAAAFYGPGEAGARFWIDVLRHIRAVE